MAIDKQQLNFLRCQDCHGSGIKENKKCPTCFGYGLAYYLQSHVLYWGKSYEPVAVAFDKTVKKINISFNFLLALIGLSGIISFAYIGWLNEFVNIRTFNYWLTPSWEKLYFWFSLLVDLYLYYRLDQESSPYFKVLTKMFGDFTGREGLIDWPMVGSSKSDKLIDISLAFTEESKNALQAAFELAKKLGNEEVTRLHLFAILPQFDKSAIILARLGVNFQDLQKKSANYLNKNFIGHNTEPKLSNELHETILLAYLEAYNSSNQKVGTPELVLSLASPEKIALTNNDIIEDILNDMELNYQKVKNVVAWIRIQEKLRENLADFRGRSRYKPKSGMDRAMTAVATPVLDQYSDDLTLRAKYGHLFPCIGRDTEIEKIFRIMEGSRSAVLLVGNHGVGKTAIIEGLSERMVIEDVPEILQDKRLVVLDVARLLAGADAAMAEQRLLILTNEIINSGNIVLVVENLHNLSGISVGQEGSMDLAEVFANILSKHLFYCIATTTPREYAKFLEGGNLASMAQIIKVEELDLNNAIWVLEAKSGPIEYQNQVYFSYVAIEKAAVLASRYIHDRYLPEKALEIMEQAAVKVAKEKGQKKVVSGEDVADVVSSLTSIPLTKITEKESEKLIHLEAQIHERMIDQEEAVKLVASSLRRARTELREGKRPIASLMFLGPTGVGKTELAKTVSEVYFNNEDAMIRIDMSEYQDQNSVYRLIGSGSTAGLLTEAVRKNPFCLVLFDEIEKAHPDILNIFLQMMDDGRLTDSGGRTIDFTNTIIIMTSNAGAQFIQDEINKGTSIEEIRRRLTDEKLRDFYRPEFLNRLDGLVVFKPLSMTDVIQIAKLMVKKIIKNLEEKGIIFEATDEAIAELAELGFDPQFGARPLRRVIQTHIDDILANYLLQGELKRRDKVILEVGGNLRIEKAEEL